MHPRVGLLVPAHRVQHGAQHGNQRRGLREHAERAARGMRGALNLLLAVCVRLLEAPHRARHLVAQLGVWGEQQGQHAPHGQAAHGALRDEHLQRRRALQKGRRALKRGATFV